LQSSNEDWEKLFLKVGPVISFSIAARDVVALKLFDLAGAETDFLVRQYRGRLGARNPGRPTTTRERRRIV
jgi:hypothetical protein